MTIQVAELLNPAVMDQDEFFDLAGEMFMDEIQRSVMMVEAVGSLRTLERWQFFESKLSSHQTLALLEKITPPSRGGTATGLKMEMEWEQMIEDLRYEYSPGVFDAMRDTFEKIVSEVKKAKAEV